METPTETKPLDFRISTDVKTVRKMIAMLDGTVLSDEEIEKMFFNREKTMILDPSKTKMDQSQIDEFIFGLTVVMYQMDKDPEFGK